MWNNFYFIHKNKIRQDRITYGQPLVQNLPSLDFQFSNTYLSSLTVRLEIWFQCDICSYTLISSMKEYSYRLILYLQAIISRISQKISYFLQYPEKSLFWTDRVPIIGNERVFLLLRVSKTKSRKYSKGFYGKPVKQKETLWTTKTHFPFNNPSSSITLAIPMKSIFHDFYWTGL